MYDFKLSLASYSFHGRLDEKKCCIFDYLDLLKYRYRLDYADIWTGFLPSLDADFLKNVKEAMREKNIKLANLCVDGPFVWTPEKEERVAHRDEMLKYIKAAEYLGAKSIRIDFGGTEGHTMSDEAFEYIVESYKLYCDICDNLGIKIGPENHWGWDRVPEYLEKVKAAVDSPAYGHLYHIGNFYDEPEKGEEIAISYAMHTHIHAASMPVAKKVIAKLAASNYEGTYSVEHHSGKHELERCDWQLGTLRSLVAELIEEGIDGEIKKDYISGLYNAE